MPAKLLGRTHTELCPGQWLREWGGYKVQVDIIRLSDGTLREHAPSGFASGPETMPDAVWYPVAQPVKSATAQG